MSIHVHSVYIHTHEYVLSVHSYTVHMHSYMWVCKRLHVCEYVSSINMHTCDCLHSIIHTCMFTVSIFWNHIYSKASGPQLALTMVYRVAHLHRSPTPSIYVSLTCSDITIYPSELLMSNVDCTLSLTEYIICSR